MTRLNDQQGLPARLSSILFAVMWPSVSLYKYAKRLMNKRVEIIKKHLIYGALTLLRLRKNKNQSVRKLEIGVGDYRLAGFETLSIIGGSHVDYVLDASKRLPFEDETFESVYASHVLEHIAWYKTEETLREWVRILKRGGRLEVWVPDGLKICQALIEAELEGKDRTYLDGWYKFNPDRDPCVWAAGRMFTYGDGSGDITSPNWHRALFTPRYLRVLFEKVGLKDIRGLSHEEVRGYDHGWINLGMGATKF